MKKTLALVVTVILMLSASISAFAVNGSFTGSPTNNSAPTLVDFTSTVPGFNGNLLITPYKNRNNLSTEKKQQLETAYKQISEAADLTAIAPEIKTVAANAKVDVKDLAVSDLFLADVDGNVATDASGKYTVTIKCDNLNKFVSLLCFNDGKWTVINDAKVDSNGNLVFTTDVLGAFATVVSTEGSGAVKPQTGEQFPWAYVVVAGVSAAALIVLAVVAVKAKKKG
ncbi:MAG: hypothetical protein ACI4FN_03935 [Acutalibacteraceae bacterium]